MPCNIFVQIKHFNCAQNLYNALKAIFKTDQFYHKNTVHLLYGVYLHPKVVLKVKSYYRYDFTEEFHIIHGEWLKENLVGKADNF